MLVFNEVGLNIILMAAASRNFVEQACWLNQALAAYVDKVVFIEAGLSMTLKDTAK